MATFLHTGGGNRRSLTKKWLLRLLIVQLCFVFCFWIIQTGFSDRTIGKVHSINGNNKSKVRLLLHNVKDNKGLSPVHDVNRVNFVTKIKNAAATSSGVISAIGWNETFLENVNQFNRDYWELNTYRLMNITGIEAEMLMEQPELGIDRRIWCFREGTLNETIHSMLHWNIDAQRPQCKCRKYWHGRDCGQPEVIWRALMLPGKQFKFHEPEKDFPPHRLVYMLEGYFHSLDFLELQIKAIDDVVDYFLIYWRSHHADIAKLKTLQRKLNELLGPQRYILHHCSQKNAQRISRTCGTVEALKYLKKKLAVKLKGQLLSTDLLLYNNENVVYSREPLKFLKYYATPEMSLWRFRLKHNVYGFFWQHPKRTHLSGFICSFDYLDNSIQLKNLLIKIHSNDLGNNENIIGDLNHYGGWFCQYCQHPDEIIKELHELPTDDSSFHRKFELPNGTRSRLIDAKYLEYLTMHGIHIDGKTQLEKIRQYNEKYFAPSYAEKHNWKYSNILANLLETMESDYINEE